jgi:hypothetical protein
MEEKKIWEYGMELRKKYKEQWDELSFDDIGMLIEAVFDYIEEGRADIGNLKSAVRMAFLFIKQKIDEE